MRHQASPEDTRPRHIGSACLGWKVQPWDHREPSWLACGGDSEARRSWEGGRRRPQPSPALPLLSPKALKILQNTASILISEGQALQLLCVADSNPPAQLSWFQVSPTLEAAPISSTGVLELLYSGTTEAELSCQAQNPLGSQNSSLSLFVFCECGVPWRRTSGFQGGEGCP